LAQRTAEQLEGSILPVEKRRALLRLSATLGLTLFDANMVLAIVQEQARRGYSPAHCPAAGAEQLALVPLPAPRGKPTISTAARRMGQAALIIAVVIGVEVLLLCWLFR
jgi:hypothetical protein